MFLVGGLRFNDRRPNAWRWCLFERRNIRHRCRFRLWEINRVTRSYNFCHGASGLCSGRLDLRSFTVHSVQHCFMSVTKGICATGVMKLVENGIISYDQPVTHYWPG